ncbi:AMP-binding protein [Pseudomonas sp. S31]|uniref:class I adenylate-forming enzyme family protein n=1 Tax=Pseudomonas sp. S31 TaxID=1564473 RepID=UPI001913C2C1|nr:fatty acid--CoA ligase family protein [Pseudomonas sp. S31]MBK4997950.1 AMP-binding protein [Pseudomonas sp. S31]
MSSSLNLGELISNACSRAPRAVAIETDDAAVDRTGLLIQARSVASRLQAAGACENEPIHVRVSNLPSDFAAVLGVWLAGCVAVPIHRTTPLSACEAIQAKTKARFQLDAGECSIDSSAILTRLRIEAPEPRLQLEGAAFVLFTSGSTGSPKGVIIGHHAFAMKLMAIDSMTHFKAGERTLLVLNITFVFGIWMSLLTLISGGTLVITKKLGSAELVDRLHHHPIDRVGVVPTMLRGILALITQGHDMKPCACLRQIFTGGEQLSESLAEQVEGVFPNADLINIYGLTETLSCDFFQHSSFRRVKPYALGLPASGVSYRIVDELGAPIAPGQQGELQIRSPYLMVGYLDDPDLTASAHSDGYFRTGDLAFINTDGDIQFRGRQKEIIVRGGNKVTPMEIEQAVVMFPGITSAMATGVEDALLGEKIHVLIVPSSTASLDFERLQAFLAGRLEKYKIPDAFYTAECVPVGRTGKADRRELKVMITTGLLVPASVKQSGRTLA